MQIRELVYAIKQIRYWASIVMLCTFVVSGESHSAPAPVVSYDLLGNLEESTGKLAAATGVGNYRFEKSTRGTVLKLDGNGSYIDTGMTNLVFEAEWTAECWVNPASKQNAFADIFGNHSGAGGVNGFVIQMDGSAQNRFAASIGNSQGGWVSTKSVQLVPDQWQHMALVKTKSDLRFYVNGILMSAVKTTYSMTPSPTSLRIGLGHENPARCLAGSVYGFRLWNYAITEWKSMADVPGTHALLLSNADFKMVVTGNKVTVGITTAVGSVPPIDVPPIKVALALSDIVTNNRITLPPLILTKANGYRSIVQKLPLIVAPSTLTVTARLSVRSDVISQHFQLLPRGVKRVNHKAIFRSLILDGDDWLVATDPDNSGRAKSYTSSIPANAKPTRVPWVIQDIFPGYHGVAWYWHDFTVPANPDKNGRYVLRFMAVDYLAEVWVNSIQVGKHEGAEDPFELDVTNAIKPNKTNRIAVRVLNPTHEGIDGIALGATARSCKTYPVTPGQTYNVGGIVDSVELLATPAIRVENIYVKPDWKTGQLDLEVNLRNASTHPIKSAIRFSVAPAQNGETQDIELLTSDLPPGDTVVHAQLRVPQHRLWSIEDPFLYRVTVTIAAASSPTSFDEKSTRCGFRDFRYENDAFRLNGKRIYLQGIISLPHYPVGFRVSPREDYFRRDLQAFKAMGFNNYRVIWGGLRARDLDLFDEMGILVQQEHYGAQHFGPDDGSADMLRRFDASISGVIRRDRNHPSIVIWCLLNEVWDGAQFQHAAKSLPLVKSLDDTRIVWLGSGGFDLQFSQGSISNPGATEWQCLMGNETPAGANYPFSWADYGAMLDNKLEVKADIHPYQSIPHTFAEIQRMRTLGMRADGRKIMISEIGTGCAVNLSRLARNYEQMGAEYADDARYYRDKLDQFMVDWQGWDLGRIWSRPEDFFTDSERNMVKLRRETGNALRANPYLAGYQICALPDSDFNGDGLLNTFRELKPGVIDLQDDLTAPLRWCLFTEPVNIYSGGQVKLEAVLSNLDVLRPGTYPVLIEVIAPDGSRVFKENLKLEIPDPKKSGEPPLVQQVFSREIPISGVTGTYKFVVRFERGAAAKGEEITFQVFDDKDMPPMTADIVLWGKDTGLAEWLTKHSINTKPYSAQTSTMRELILVGNDGGDFEAFKELAARIARGSTAIFLSPSVFTQTKTIAAGSGLLGGFAEVPLDRQQLAALPLVNKGTLTPSDSGGYYRGDTFAPKHPLFDGLPSGGILDYSFYRNIISQGGIGLMGTDTYEELIAGGIRAQIGYGSVVQTAFYKLGAGRFLFNTLRIRENLGSDPVAERLLRNMLNYSARDVGKPVTDLPADFAEYLRKIGY